MGRTSADVIVAAIIEALKSSPRSINELKDLADSNRLTITKYLVALESTGLVTKQREGKEFLYRLQPLTTKQRTYFDLPITREQENLIDGLFKLIKNAGIRSKTLAQKLIVTLNERIKLNIPIVWYLYGPMTIKAYDPDQDYDATVPTRIEQTMKQLLGEQHSLQDLINSLYEKKELYALKKQLEQNLDNYEKSITLLRQLIKEVPRTAEMDVLYFEGLFLVLTKKKEKNQNIPSLFVLLWELIAIKYLEEQLTTWYEKDAIANKLSQILHQRQLSYDQLIDETYDCIEVEAFGEKLQEKERKMFWGSTGRGEPIKKLTREERKQLFIDFMKNPHRSDIFREFGLD